MNRSEPAKIDSQPKKDMGVKGRVPVFVLLTVLGLVASWMLGYREGRQTGAVRLLHEMSLEYAEDYKGRPQVCDEIRHYKLSMAKDLNDNTQICRWPDLDGPKNSN